MGTIKLSTKVSSSDKGISIKDAIENMFSAMKKYAENFASSQQIYDYDSIISAIGYSIDEIGSVLINAGCNEEYVKAYKEWGNFGWSFNANINNKFFLTAPKSSQEADSIMLKYANVESITRMMEELKNFDVNKKDLEEAYFAYINQKYKSSVLLLFSLIDRQLINRALLNENGYLKTGASAVGELKKSEKLYKENTYLHYLQFTLIINCLFTLFQNSKNFEKEPVVINRNFLIHGMSNNEVNGIDCLKVWSALYSFVVIFPKLEKEILLSGLKN
ncbi:MAG: hypothetical protein DBX61_01415 [Clostridiales bacterium]|nr:MAG: hypothetical protein DBX61_01415 [Clostridiales bacterium]